MKKRLLVLILVALMLASVPMMAFAQEATEAPAAETSVEAEEAEAPQGVSTLILLLGVGALLLVGGAVIARSNNPNEPTAQGPY